jgi:hypothetical protein
MDIRHKQLAIKDSSTATHNKKSTLSKHKVGVVGTSNALVVIPPAIREKLAAISSQYNLPINLGNVALDGKMAENVKAVRQIVDMVTGDSKLLPELMKQISRLMKADIKLVEFHTNVTKAALKHQEKLDRATSDIFLAMAGYSARASKLEHRVNTRAALIDRRTAAYNNLQENSIYGDQSKIIEAEFEVLASDSRILAESRVKRSNFNQGQRQKLQEYVDSAFA